MDRSLALLTTAATSLATVAALAACSAPAATPASGTPTEMPTAKAEPTVPAMAAVRQPVWEAQVGGEMWSSPALLGGVVVVGDVDGTVHGLDAATGAQLWTAPIGAPVRATPLVVGDTAYVMSDGGAVYAVDAMGTEVWSADVGPGTKSRTTWDQYGARPAAGDGVIFAATASGVVAALDATTGDQVWSRELDSGVQSDLAVSDGLVQVSTMGGTHVALSMTDGSEVWAEDGSGALTTSPLVAGGQVFTGSRGGSLKALDEATGEFNWSASFGSSWVQSGATEMGPDAVVIGSSDFLAVRAFATADGADVWLTDVTGWPWGVPSVADGVVYETQIMAPKHKPWDTALYALSAEDGSVLWTAAGGESVTWRPDGEPVYGAATRPLIAGDLVIVSGLDGVVRAYERG